MNINCLNLPSLISSEVKSISAMLNSLLKYKYKYSTKDLSTSTSTEERTDVQVPMYLAVCLLAITVNYQPGTGTCVHVGLLQNISSTYSILCNSRGVSLTSFFRITGAKSGLHLT